MLKISKRLLAIICCLVFIISLAACGSQSDTPTDSGTASEDTTSEAADTESTSSSEEKKTGSGQLSIYTAFPEEHVSKLFKQFEDDTGVEVKYVRLSAGEIYARVQSEGNNPQASLWFGTSNETLEVAGQEGFLQEYTSPMLEYVDEKFHDPNSLWTPHCAQIICFLTNESWLEQNNIEAPTSWDELLDPIYENNIAIAHPATSGMSYTWLAYMCQLMGEDEAFDYLQNLNTNIFQYAKSSNSPPRMVGMEECGLTVGFNNQGMTNRDAGYPIAISYPAEGTSYETAGMAIIKNCPEDELENAKLFIDWSLGKEVQEEYVSYAYTVPMNSEAQVPEGMVPMSELKTIDLDVEWGSENRERLLNRFETEIRGQENLA